MDKLTFDEEYNYLVKTFENKEDDYSSLSKNIKDAFIKKSEEDKKDIKLFSKKRGRNFRKNEEKNFDVKRFSYKFIVKKNKTKKKKFPKKLSERELIKKLFETQLSPEEFEYYSQLLSETHCKK